MVVGAKVCELTDGFLWFVCGLYVGILTSPLTHFVTTTKKMVTGHSLNIEFCNLISATAGTNVFSCEWLHTFQRKFTNISRISFICSVTMFKTILFYACYIRQITCNIST